MHLNAFVLLCIFQLSTYQVLVMKDIIKPVPEVQTHTNDKCIQHMLAKVHAFKEYVDLL